MFKLLTVRGIPLHKLGISGFFPALDSFDPREVEQRMSIACNVIAFIAGLILLVSTLVAGFETPDTALLLTIQCAGIIALLFIFSIADGLFASRLRYLDKLLIETGRPGLPELPAAAAEITKYLDDVCLNEARMILHYDSISLFHEGGRHHRKRLEQLILTSTKLKIGLDDCDQYVCRVKYQKLAQEEKEKQLKAKAVAQAEQTTKAVEQAITTA